MLLFTRVATLRGGPRKAMGFATQALEHVRDKTDLEPSLWTVLFGAPVGTMGWSARVESKAQLSGEMMKLMGNEEFQSFIEKNYDVFGTETPQDHLRQVIHEAGDGEGSPVGAVGTLVTATANVDRMQEAIQWGIEMADYASGVTGMPRNWFLADAYGQMGQLSWIGSVDDMAAADAATDALMADPGYLDKLKSAGEIFIPGSGHQTLLMRVA